MEKKYNLNNGVVPIVNKLLNISSSKNKKNKILKGSGVTKTKSEVSNNSKNSNNNKETENLILKLDTENYLKNKVKVKKRYLLWGLGIEHEMQIFHLGKKKKLKKNDKDTSEKYENANIIFDSQEATCLITDDDDDSGACKKKVSRNIDMLKISKSIPKKIILNNKRLTNEEFNFLNSLDWELSGRQDSTCKGSKQIVKRTPILMPELVTSDFQNRTINSIVNESILQEETFIKCMMKNIFVKEKVRKYGPLVTHLCGSLDNINVPEKPTFINSNYELSKAKYKDYVGSYHVTITLPHYSDIETKDFVKMHQNMANQIQWLEPLLLTSFFSPDPSAVGIGPKKGIEGSFRIMATGWGNMAGSDVRKFGNVGITRGASIKTNWRKGFKLKGTEKLDICVKSSLPQYKKSVDILTSDFRTFNLEEDDDICDTEKYENDSDCPKIDGAPMEPPFGVEIRIFDHFPSKYLIDLMKIIVLIAANSMRYPPKSYVYKNKIWIKTIQDIMTHGWNTQLKYSYIVLLRRELGLKIVLKDNNFIAYNVFKLIVKELYDLNHEHEIIRLMDETAHIEPKLPEINKLCWNLSFNQKYYKKIIKDIKKNRDKLKLNKKNFTLNEFKKLINRSNYTWKHQMTDLLYALQSKNKVELAVENGFIKKIKLLF